MGQTTFTGPVASQNGFIDASFTTAERDAIVNPTAGLLIYNTTTNTYQVCTVGGGTPTWDTAFAPPGPNITNVSPSSGTTGTSVTITGTGFTGATSVTFNGVNAGSYTVNSATQITAAAPATGTTSPVDVVVTTPTGSSTEVAAFTNTTPATPTTYEVTVDYQNPAPFANFAGVLYKLDAGQKAIRIDSSQWTNLPGYNNLAAQPAGTVYTIVLQGSGGTGTFTQTDSFVGGIAHGTCSLAVPTDNGINSISFTA